MLGRGRGQGWGVLHDNEDNDKVIQRSRSLAAFGGARGLKTKRSVLEAVHCENYKKMRHPQGAISRTDDTLLEVPSQEKNRHSPVVSGTDKTPSGVPSKVQLRTQPAIFGNSDTAPAVQSH